MSWKEFFKTRRRLQLIQRIAGVPFAFGFLTCETAALSLPIFDPTRLIFGIDPLVVVGISTIAGTILSYAAGVAVSGVIWRKFRPQLASNLNEVRKIDYTCLFILKLEAEELLCSRGEVSC